MLQTKKIKLFFTLLTFVIVIVLGYFAYQIFWNKEALATNISFEGNKSITKNIQYFGQGTLTNKEKIILKYNLNGVCILDGLSSALTLTAINGKTYSVSLSEYGANCVDGVQTAIIPITDFNIDQQVESILSLDIQFWYPTQYSIQIEKIKIEEPVFVGISSQEIQDTLYAKVIREPVPQKKSRTTPTNSPVKKVAVKPTVTPKSPTQVATSTKPKVSTLITPKPTTPTPTIPTTVVTATSTHSPAPTPILVPTPIPATTPTQNPSNNFWSIRSVSSMKQTKDKVCSQDSIEQIKMWVDKAAELGINYISVETPYDNPSCASSVAYTKMWVDAIRARGLNVWHRHAPLAFEGIYSATKDSSKNYIEQISKYIKDNPTFFKEGDIFTPVPEPQNGGIKNITYCPQNICIFSDAAHFNKWLRDAITSSESAFASIGLGGKIKIGYYGFDGFVVWGDNNPDWDGILEDATIAIMGNITIDHYPEIVNDNMNNDLNELQAKYPNIPIIIGEWGTITGGDTVAQVNNSMQAAMRAGVIGFNYWHFGLGGNESLVSDGLSPKIQFDAVKSFFTR